MSKNKEAIEKIKKLEKENPNVKFWAEGYVPNDGMIDEEETEAEQYYTEWEDLTAEELIDKLIDENYDITDWDEEGE